MDSFFCENNIYSALPAGYKGLSRIEHVTSVFFSKSLQSINRIARALPENCDDSLQLQDPTLAAATVVLSPT